MNQGEKRLWTPEEVEIIVAAKGDFLTDVQLSHDMDRSIQSIRSKRNRILRERSGASQERPKVTYPVGKKSYERWSKEDLQLIRESELSDEVLAKQLGKSANSIRVKRYQLRKEL